MNKKILLIGLGALIVAGGAYWAFGTDSNGAAKDTLKGSINVALLNNGGAAQAPQVRQAVPAAQNNGNAILEARARTFTQFQNDLQSLHSSTSTSFEYGYRKWVLVDNACITDANLKSEVRTYWSNVDTATNTILRWLNGKTAEDMRNPPQSIIDAVSTISTSGYLMNLNVNRVSEECLPRSLKWAAFQPFYNQFNPNDMANLTYNRVSNAFNQLAH